MYTPKRSPKRKRKKFAWIASPGPERRAKWARSKYDYEEGAREWANTEGDIALANLSPDYKKEAKEDAFFKASIRSLKRKGKWKAIRDLKRVKIYGRPRLHNVKSRRYRGRRHSEGEQFFSPWLQKKMRYGNWCGPNWSAGKEQASVSSHLVDVPPTGIVDTACMHHDTAYAEGQNKAIADLKFAVTQAGNIISAPSGQDRRYAAASALAVGVQGIARLATSPWHASPNAGPSFVTPNRIMIPGHRVLGDVHTHLLPVLDTKRISKKHKKGLKFTKA